MNECARVLYSHFCWRNTITAIIFSLSNQSRVRLAMSWVCISLSTMLNMYKAQPETDLCVHRVENVNPDPTWKLKGSTWTLSNQIGFGLACDNAFCWVALGWPVNTKNVVRPNPTHIEMSTWIQTKNERVKPNIDMLSRAQVKNFHFLSGVSFMCNHKNKQAMTILMQVARVRACVEKWQSMIISTDTSTHEDAPPRDKTHTTVNHQLWKLNLYNAYK